MRILLIVLLAIHGTIHLMGFFRAFGFSELNAINQSISKMSGLIWLLTFLLFAVTLGLFLIRSQYWWVWGVIGVIVSQVLIFNYWSDTKFGTFANLIILLSTVVAYSNYNFENKIRKDRTVLMDNSENNEGRLVTSTDIVALPLIVQKWLTNSGVVGKPFVSDVHLVQELDLKLKPAQKKWNPGVAEQYFTIQPPAFNWYISTKSNTFISVTGRDQFVNGKGEMSIKLFSLFPVVSAINHNKLDEATLQRYLSEIVWFPSAALSPYVKWEYIDSSSAKAIMEFNGTIGSGIFHFDNNGQFKEFVTMRYKELDDKEPTQWRVTASKTEERNGVKIPTECEVTWDFKNEQWTWLKLKIKHIKYNVEKISAHNK